VRRNGSREERIKDYLTIGMTRPEATEYVDGEDNYDMNGETGPLFAAQIRYCRTTVFRRNARRWLGSERRPENTHYASDGDGRSISIACSKEWIRPDGKQEYKYKEGHEPKVFSGEGRLYTFDRWWVTCENCKKGIKNESHVPRL
jgi:hypothetical protein